MSTAETNPGVVPGRIFVIVQDDWEFDLLDTAEKVRRVVPDEGFFYFGGAAQDRVNQLNEPLMEEYHRDIAEERARHEERVAAYEWWGRQGDDVPPKLGRLRPQNSPGPFVELTFKQWRTRKADTGDLTEYDLQELELAPNDPNVSTS